MSPRTSGFQLTKQDVIDAALRLLSQQGVGQLSMRRLATEVGVSPMAIYYHVADKDALLDLATEAIYASVDLPDRGPWDDRLTRLLRSLHEVLDRYPGATSYLLSRGTAAPTGLHIVNTAIQWLLDAGFDEQEAADACVAAGALLIGQSQLQAFQQAPGSMPGGNEINLSAIPAILRIAPHLQRRVGPQDFEKLITMFVSDLKRKRRKLNHTRRAKS